MAMSVVYTTFDGELVHENRGGVSSFYAPDTMGSTVALLNSVGVVTDTYGYWPYGEIQSHVGSSQTPFTFLGTLGYYLDVVGSFLYVRARYLRQALARWQTVDRLWPRERPYGYVNSSPAQRTDPSGQSSCGECAINIYKDWDPTPQHECRALYSHCMACCVLSHYFGRQCAQQSQTIQERFRTGLAYRMPICQVGISIGLHQKGNILSGCDSECARRYSPNVPSRGGACSRGGMSPYPYLPFGCAPAVFQTPNPGHSFPGSPDGGGSVVHTGGCSGVGVLPRIRSIENFTF